MDQLLASKPPCPGFRFYPTDEELFMYYLKRKVSGKRFPYPMISEVDIYRFPPWDLQNQSCLKSKDLYWYFFCRRVKKSANSGRTHRLTNYGYWKSTGSDRTVKYDNRPVGKIKTLVFHHGKPPSGDRTDWVMHEYRLDDQQLADEGIPQDSYVICKIYEKSGLGPKNGEHYGAPFMEEEWESDEEGNVETDQRLIQDPNSFVLADNSNALNTCAGLPGFSTEQLSASVSAAWTPSATTEQTVRIETEPANPDLPLVNRLEEMVNNDCYDGLEDLNLNVKRPQSTFDLGDLGGFMEMDDLNGQPIFSPAFVNWPQFPYQMPADDPTGFIELDDFSEPLF